MADSDVKKRSIPEWQKQSGETAPEDSASASPQSSDDAPEASPRAVLLEQASKFLEDDSIRDAPTDRKIAFLESKGLQQEEIQKLLGVSRNAEASSDETEKSDSAPLDSTADASSESPSHPSTQAPSTSQAPASSTSSSSSSSTSVTSSSRDVPPIITYPEFLLEASKPPPLFTFRSILYTLYGAAGLGATIYGASEYLVKPMLETLTGARHELAQTAQQNLRELNEKLEQNVSTVPPYPSRAAAAAAAKGSADTSDSDSITSDPTELFHRDIATQTTPDISRATSTPNYSTDTDDAESVQEPIKAVVGHVGRLRTLNSHLREFKDAESQARVADDLVRDRLSELQTYLDSLTYSGSSYLNTNVYGVYTGGSSDKSTASNGVATGMLKGEEDAISSFKAEIRGVKGALLSARNFPAGRGGRIAAGVAR